MKNKLTVILPLKERPEFTKIWLENNYNEYYEYIIADGSHSEKNKEIFLNLFSNSFAISGDLSFEQSSIRSILIGVISFFVLEDNSISNVFSIWPK